MNKTDIINSLIKHGVSLPCPRCKGKDFTTFSESHICVVDGDKGIPTVIVMCSGCGFISMHAKGVLGLLN